MPRKVTSEYADIVAKNPKRFITGNPEYGVNPAKVIEEFEVSSVTARVIVLIANKKLGVQNH